MLARLVGYPILCLAGALTAVCGAFVSRNEQVVAGIAVPYGLVLALGVLAGLLWVGARGGTGGALATAGGWAVPTVVFLIPRSEGDIILGADWLGLGYLLGGLALALWAVLRSAASTPPASRPGSRSPGPHPASDPASSGAAPPPGAVQGGPARPEPSPPAHPRPSGPDPRDGAIRPDTSA